MAERSRVGRVVIPVVALVALAYLPKVAAPDAWVYRAILTADALSVLASATKLTALGAGALFAAKSASRFESGNPVRVAWWMLAAFLGAFFLGQIALSTYELVLRVPLPLPSIGDAFFLVGYGAMIAAALRFVLVYRASGFPLGHRLEHPLLAIASTAILATIAAPLLAPIARAPRPLGERFVDLVYPLLDFVALVPIVLLTRITWHFRGGRVWSVWATLLAGLLFASGGDVAFAYWTSAARTRLEPLTDALLIVSYVLLAAGAALQLELLDEARREAR